KDGKDESKSKETKKPVKNKKNEDPASGWFGGIWEKFRPKNQMRLPDDKNPSIVWDQEQKRWVNLEGDDEDKPEVKAPPRASELLPTSQMSTTNLPPESSAVLSTAPPGVNKYKLQKGRRMCHCNLWKNNFKMPFFFFFLAKDPARLTTII
ncbi:hypothetical protein AAG570_011183, partial [Ranatra chinensis]